MLRSLFLALFAALCLAACGAGTDEPRPLGVHAASRLQEALEAEADAWAAHGHPRPTLSFAASSALARQVESGAPADLFLSADEKWMDALQKDGKVAPGTRGDLLGNSLVLIAPKDSKATVDFTKPASLAAALGPKGKLSMADPASVPAGIYGKEALGKLGLWAGVEGKVASAENVRAALALVESGEAPLGVVYATDAKASARVRVVATFPETSHEPITYPVAVIAGAPSADAAGFRAFLASDQAQAIFARYGFTKPE
jgi:molybdate transport system substrate-binding protein